MGSAVRIVFDAFHFSRDAILVATEVDDAVVFMATATMTRGDVTIVITATGGRFLSNRAACGAPLCRSGFTTLTTARRPAEVGFTLTIGMLYLLTPLRPG